MPRKSVLLLCLVASELTLPAQSPNAYSATVVNAMMGAPATMQIVRDGAKVIVENSPGNSHTRTFYDLDRHASVTWDPANRTSACTWGTFQGDWGDPFAMSAEMNGELAKANAKEVGAATLNGFPTKVWEASDPATKMKSKAWVDPKLGLIVKLELTGADGKPVVITEVKELTVAKPAASLFAVPAACGAAPKPEPTEKERIAAETGDSAENFTNAITGPASPNSCSMVLRVVRAGSMQPLTAYQAAVDLNVHLDHPAGYSMGQSANGHTTFSGGSLKEITGQMQNGSIKVDNVPGYFDIELAFGKAGASSALIYRHCAGPETVLLFVVKNPEKLSDGGDWLWVKSGKFVGVTQK